jgi:AcrR family transcriptional regulator
MVHHAGIRAAEKINHSDDMATVKKRRRENSNHTANKILEVAAILFSVKGFKGTSIRDIAREAGMTSSNLYHHFGTKEKLLFAIEKATIKPILEELQKISSLDLPPLDHLVLMLRTHLSYIGTHQNESKIIANHEIYVPGREEYKQKAQKEIFIIYRTVIERQLANAGKHGNASFLTLNTFGVINWFPFWYKPDDGRLPLQAVIEYVIDFILYGITSSRFSLQPSDPMTGRLPHDFESPAAKG